MNERIFTVIGSDFAAFAERQLEVWSQLEGTAVEHVQFGEGQIEKVTQRKDYVPLISVRFSSRDGSATFNSDGFKAGAFRAIHIPHSLALLFSQWWKQVAADRARHAAEEAARLQFRELAEKYNVPSSKVGITPLLPILLKLENREDLEASEVQWLEEEKIFNLLATYFYRRFNSDRDAWKLVKACRYLRDAALPGKAIAISSRFVQRPAAEPRVLAALFTSRGGAFRDLSELGPARQSADEAIRLSPHSFYPYNLLGAICYEEGDPVEGDKYFAMATTLGAHPITQEAEIQTALNRSGVEVKRRVATYLLEKDPKKHAWAASYLAEAQKPVSDSK